MVTKTGIVLDPTAKPRVQEVRMAPRVRDPDGKTIGLLWNGKPNADILLRRIREQLSQKFCLGGTSWHEKPDAGVPAKAATLDELARTSDVFIIALGD